LIETGQAQLVTWDHVEERIAEHRSPRPSG
jgi:hypothetical protein